MRHRAAGGWVEVVAGVMFSGKSEELIRRVRRALIAGRRVQLFKSHLDDRYGGQFRISSHDGREIDAEPVSSSVEVAEKVRPSTQVVAIDEAQFLDDGICEVVDALADAGKRVIVVGTDMDFRGEPFGPMGLLLARAERIDKLTAICVACGDPATRNQRLIDGSRRRRGPDDPGGGRRILRGALPPVPRRTAAGSQPDGAVAAAQNRGLGRRLAAHRKSPASARQPPGMRRMGYGSPGRSRSARKPQFAKPSSDCGSSRLKSRRPSGRSVRASMSPGAGVTRAGS